MIKSIEFSAPVLTGAWGTPVVVVPYQPIKMRISR